MVNMIQYSFLESNYFNYSIITIDAAFLSNLISIFVLVIQACAYNLSYSYRTKSNLYIVYIYTAKQ